MAQPHYVVEYISAMSVLKGKTYSSTDILTTFPTANMIKMKTDNVKVSIDGSDMFQTSYDGESYITSGRTYIFDKDCIIAICRYVDVI